MENKREIIVKCYCLSNNIPLSSEYLSSGTYPFAALKDHYREVQTMEIPQTSYLSGIECILPLRSTTLTSEGTEDRAVNTKVKEKITYSPKA